ncbi:MAG: alanine racemase [Patescibacteria group bacterium]
MINLLRQLIKPRYESLNRIEIVASNLLFNYDFLQSLKPQSQIWPVLKSNAYGHGLKEVCQILNRSQARMVVVDSFPEAQIVYSNFKGRVLILGEMPLGTYKYCNFNRTEFCVYNLDTIKYLAQNHPGAKIHLFLNTGMNREGIKDIKSFYEAGRESLSRLQISGICSHLAASGPKTDEQENKFLSMVSYLKEQGINPRYLHLSNSLGFFTAQNKLANTFRIGLSFYGYGDERLKPALRVYSKIVALQDLEPGETVSYGTDYVVQKKTRAAVIPFGYFEGLDRRLGPSQIRFKLQGREVKIAGRISMNLTVLDIGDIPAAVGQEVELISNECQALNSVESIAQAIDTIPYEVLVRLQANIRRVIV